MPLIYFCIPECRLWWDSSKLTEATQVKAEFKLNLIRPDSKFSNKWQHMGLDDHLQTSIVAGLIDKFRGASHYINDQMNPSQATQTLVCRTKSRKERLDLPALLENNPLRFPNSTEAGVDWSLPKATHVVVGIVYGAEAYCVLTQDLGSQEADEDAREEAEENLGKFVTKLENVLGDIDFDNDLPDFKEQFNKDEKAQLTRLKCRLYSDLQTSAVRECNVVDVYAQCLKMIKQIKNDVENKCKAIPITVLLCPLKTILELSDGRQRKSFEYRDVDPEITARLCRNWVQLESIQTKVEAIRSNAKKVSRPSLRTFQEVLNKYKDLLRKSLKNGVLQAREGNDGDDYEVDRVTTIAEDHALFKPSRLERWLDLKVSESKTVTKISNINGIVFVAGKTQLEKQLADSFDTTYALVLNIPPLDGKANEILVAMKDYCEDYTKLVAVEDEDVDMEEEEGNGVDEDGLPWHMVPRKTKQVMDKIREFAHHVEKNKHLENQVQFYITSGEPGKGGCRYSVYEADNLLKVNIRQLPVPPTEVKIRYAPTKSTKKSTSLIIVTWDYEDHYPCVFIVEFRPKNSSDSWKQQKTTKSGETQMILNFNSSGPELEIRVAADTCIGRSEFSAIVDTESELGVINIDDSAEEMECPTTREVCAYDSRREASQNAASSLSVVQRTNQHQLQPPTGLQTENVTQSTAELSWNPLIVARYTTLSYRVRYWRDGQTPSSAHEMDVTETGCRL